jgi:hypothetical protein
MDVRNARPADAAVWAVALPNGLSCAFRPTTPVGCLARRTTDDCVHPIKLTHFQMLGVRDANRAMALCVGCVEPLHGGA